MNKITRHIPNALTLVNLLSGVTGLIFASQGDIKIAACFIWSGAVFDFFDGFFARKLKTFSDIGRELDSLADMVTFGILPSMIMYYSIAGNFLSLNYLACSAFLIPVFSALRLARFNIDPRQKEVFIGLPTPANAFFISGLPFLWESRPFQFTGSPAFLVPALVFTSVLMVSPFRFVSLKFKTPGIRGNALKYLILISAILLVLAFQARGVTPAVSLYIVVSLASALKTPSHAGMA